MGYDVLLKILDLARWAPSGDNTQPWRFEIVADDHIAIHGFDTRDHVLYDFDGHASHMAHGALLETLRIAATRFGVSTEWSIRAGLPDTSPIYDVKLKSVQVQEDPLASVIKTRTVQRRPMRSIPMDDDQRRALIESVGPEFSLKFYASLSERWSVARLLWGNAYLRLTCPEAYEVHRDVIEWDAQYSVDRIPDQAVGVDVFTAKLMSWVMQSWGRVDFFNRYLFGTVLPRLQLDVLPAIRCAAHVLIQPGRAFSGHKDYVLAGIAMQRFWLTATRLGLFLQPEMTPVIFRWYVQAGRAFSRRRELSARAHALANDFEQLAGALPQDQFCFFARVGLSTVPRSRSLRLKLDSLMDSRHRFGK